MKEYIAKEDMRKAITDSISECQGSYEAVKRQHEIIDEMLKLPTVTKADILADLKKNAELLMSADHNCRAVKLFWSDLMEMEQGE